MRLIDADKLVKAVEDLADCYNGFSDTYDKACIIGLIDEQPTISPKQGAWIPVSERLPEVNEYAGDVQKYYLVQNEYGDMMVACYKGNKTGTWWEQMYKYDEIEDSIVAWMLLPEPYKEEVTE